ncbi:MAG TPA: LuxR C-terminal-related transcriptional regulator [Candidatus Limnocylindrales bacterium]|nr:LuxR C-terminal-related transcriptional regulator [Candidatus Limnocylindrales bacterium]
MRGRSGSLDPLIGRESELGALLGALATGRLVTLTGPGGSGKTRLADAAVTARRDAGGGAWFVDCSAVDHTAILGAVIAAAMDLDGSGQDPLDAVIASLRGETQTLLALDNLEQIDSAGLVATKLVESVPGLTILATSRVPLRVRGEIEFAVPPLALPTDASPASIVASPAGELFLARAHAVSPSAQIDDATATDIAALLARLDGLPLAIELAAARTRSITPGEILRRLGERGPESIDARDTDDHRSLRAILDWTLGQLSADDGEALEAASVAAGFDLGLIEALAPDVDALDAIDSLVGLGLARRVADSASVSRFRLLETIRATVLRRMDAERLALLQDRHAEHFVAVAADWHRLAADGVSGELAERFNVDADNIRVALDYLESTDPRRAVVLLSWLGPFWSAHGRVGEGLGHLKTAFNRSRAPSVELARAAAGQLGGLWSIIPPGEYREYVDRTLDLARSAGDKESLIEALKQRAYLAVNENDASGLEAVVAEFEQVCSEDTPGDRLNLADIHTLASALIDGRESDRHVDVLRRFIVEVEGTDDHKRLAFARGNLATSLLWRGEFAAAIELARQAVDTLIELDRLADVAWALAILAPSLAEAGRTQEAVEAAIECATCSVESAQGENIGAALWAAMPVALSVGRADLTTRLWAALDRGVLARNEAALVDQDRRLAERWTKTAERSMSKVEWELEMRDGERADPVELLRELPRELRAAAATTAPSERLRHGEFTKREVEILSLVGQGLSDGEIAEKLFISPKTASVHVANVKSKLGVDSRLQIALRARELGLVDAQRH